MTLLPLLGLAQDIRSGEMTSHTERLNGYFVGIKDDTSRVIFEIPFYRNAIDYEKIQGTWVQRVKYLDHLGRKKAMSLWHTKMFGFTLSGDYNHEQITMVANSNWTLQRKHSDSGTFLKLQVDGKLKCYIQFRDERPLGGILRTGQLVKNYLFQKGDSAIVPLKANFIKQMTGIVADNGELVMKIRNKIYTARDSEQIAKEYNGSARD